MSTAEIRSNSQSGVARFSEREYLFLIAAATCAYILPGMAVRSLGMDELTSLYFARPEVPLSDGLFVWSGSTHPPAYYFLLRLWSGVFGQGQVISRILSLFAFAILISALLPYRRLLPRRAFVFFVSATLVSPFVAYYAGDARSYIFLLVATALAFLTGYPLYSPNQKNVSLSQLLAFIASAALVSAVHYFGHLFVLSMMGLLIVHNWRKRIITSLSLLLATVIISLFELGWIIYSWPNISSQTGGQGWLAFQPLIAFLQLGEFLFSYNFLVPAAALTGIAIAVPAAWKNPLFRFASLVFVIGLMLGIGVSLHTPVLQGRTLATFAIPAFVVTALGLDQLAERLAHAMPQLGNRTITVVIAGLVLLTSLGSIRMAILDRDGWKTGARIMLANGCSGKFVLTSLWGDQMVGFDAPFYFEREVGIASPKFVSIRSVSFAEVVPQAACRVKAFVINFQAPPDRVWVLAQQVFHTGPTYLKVDIAKGYLLLDAPVSDADVGR